MLFALWSSAAAQQPKKVPRIGYLSSFTPARESARNEGIRLALRELGYVEGQNIATEYRYAEGKLDRLLRLRPSWCVSRLISSWSQEGPATIRAAMNATKTIPIIMTGAGADPVEAGLVESLARPGGNVTGLKS